MIETITALGFVTAICAGWAVVLLAIIGLVRLSNRVSHLVVEMYGGWGTFLKFRQWYFDNYIAKSKETK